jgi:radical SAM superfamily enzyme YgiQ (UPF0313 family)
VIWGGTHPSIAPEECIQTADFVCIGEGEFPMLDLVRCLSDGSNLDDIQNIWINKNGEVKRNPIRPLVKNLDSFPFPDYGDQGKYLIENNETSMCDPALERFNIDIIASRGCPFNCSFCCNNVFRERYRGKGPAVRRRSADNIIGEVQYLKEKIPELKRVDFMDEVFGWEKDWAFEFSAKYQEKINLPFQCYQHPNMIDKAILERLKEAGLERVEVGLESGSERIRMEVFKRKISDESFIRSANILKEVGIIPFYDYIVDNPFETEEDKRACLDFLLKLPRPYHLRMFPLTYFPNTSLTKEALELGIISEDQVESKRERTHDKWFVTLDYPWPDRERFWISLFSLTSKRFVPKGLIRRLSRSDFFKKKPKFLSSLATLANNIKLGLIAVKWVFDGKPLKAIFRHSSRGRSHWQI